MFRNTPQQPKRISNTSLMNNISPAGYNRAVGPLASIQAIGNMDPSNARFRNPMTAFGLGSPFAMPLNYGIAPMPPGQIPPFDRTPR